MTKNQDHWRDSAAAWIKDQGERGDWSRRVILDPTLDKILSNLSGKRVLDLGCGEGRYSRVLKSRGAIVTGIDPTEPLIACAKQRDPESEYLLAAAESLPLADASFDMVLSYLSLIDIPDLESASREMIRVLKPGGEIMIVTISNLASSTPYWIKSWTGKKLYRKVERYMEHFAMNLEWRGIRIVNYHRPLSYILGLFLNHGCVLTQFHEPLPPVDDSHYTIERRCPNFQIYGLRRL